MPDNNPPRKPTKNGPRAPKKPRKGFGDDTEEDRIADIATKIRILEDRYSTMRKKIQMTDKALIDAQREFERERKMLEEELTESQRRIEELSSIIEVMQKEIREAVDRKDFTFLQKYLEYWDVSSFIRRDDADAMIEQFRDLQDA